MVMQLCWQAPEIKGDLSVFKIVTTWSPDAGRYTTTFNNAMNLDKNLTFKNELRFPRSSGAHCYISILDNLYFMLWHSDHRFLNAFTVSGLAQKYY
jgi:hypothetical protein